MFAECRLDRLISLVSIANPGQAPNCHIGEKTKLVADVAVGNLMEVKLPETFGFKRYSCQPIASLVESLDRLAKTSGRCGIGQELGLQNKFHALIVRQDMPNVNYSLTIILKNHTGAAISLPN